MNLLESVSSVYRQYFGFSGRACRSEYWWFALFNSVVALILSIAVPILYFIFVIGTIAPALGVLVRRLHDTGRTGWWALIMFVPIIGAIGLLIFAISEGESGDNRYGPNPIKPGA